MSGEQKGKEQESGSEEQERDTILSQQHAQRHRLYPMCRLQYILKSGSR